MPKPNIELQKSGNPNMDDIGILLGNWVELNINPDDISLDDSPKPLWVQVARVGDYPGYANGAQPFKFTEDHFKEAIENIHKHPSFTLGSNGVGTSQIIPWDFEHSSAMNPAYGNISVVGAPSQGWTYDLKLGKDKNGVTTLLAYTLFLEPARSYVKTGKYKWSSVFATFNTIHPETGNDIGLVIKSIALTNIPFIEGMMDLAASKQASLGRRYFGQAENATSAVNMMKELFGLPELADIKTVMGEINKLSSWIDTKNIPLGIDILGIMSSLREILGLPALSTEIEIIGQAKSITSRLIDELSVNSGMAPIGSESIPIDQLVNQLDLTNPAMMAKGADMELLKNLAIKLGVRESDDAVVAAVDDLVSLRSGVVDLMKLDQNTATKTAILGSTNSLVDESSNLQNLFNALGVTDFATASAKIVSLVEANSKYDEIAPKYEEMKKIVDAQKEKDITADVDQVMNSYGFSEDLKTPLMLYRKSDPKGFAEKYPKKDIQTKPQLGGQNALLTKTIVASPNGGQINVGDGGVASPGVAMVDLGRYPGRNTTERALAYVRANVNGANDWSYDDQFVAACEFKNQPNVVDSKSTQ